MRLGVLYKRNITIFTEALRKMPLGNETSTFKAHSCITFSHRVEYDDDFLECDKKINLQRKKKIPKTKNIIPMCQQCPL